LIISGPGVRAGEFADVKIIDVAPTVAALFELRPPANAEGRNIFGEEEAPTELVLVAVAAIAAAIVICIAYILIGKRRVRVEAVQPTPLALEAGGW
jgi:hypothetical protein